MAFSLVAIEERTLKSIEKSWIDIYRASLSRKSFRKIQHLSVLGDQSYSDTPTIFVFTHYKSLFFREPKTSIRQYYRSIDSDNYNTNKNINGIINEISFSELYPDKDLLNWTVWEPPDIKSHILRQYPHLKDLPDLL